MVNLNAITIYMLTLRQRCRSARGEYHEYDTGIRLSNTNRQWSSISLVESHILVHTPVEVETVDAVDARVTLENSQDVLALVHRAPPAKIYWLQLQE